MSHLGRAVAALILLAGPASVRAWGQDSSGRQARATINDIQMAYTVQGQGPPLLLLHYFGGCGQVWQPHIERLAREFRLIIPDLRGHGGSTNPSGQFTHRQAAHDVFALLDQLGIPRLKAMGTSSGGMTLLHMATQQAGRIDAMFLIGATSYFPPQARMIMRKTSPTSLSAQEQAEMRRCHGDDAQIAQLLGQFHRMKDSYDDVNFTDPYLGTITARTLIVHGDRDEFFPVAIPVQM